MNTLSPTAPCIITGSSSGIGRAISDELLDHGRTVVGLARQHAKYQPNTPHYIPHTVDFNDLTHTEQLAKHLVKTYPNLDTIICCAGLGRFGQLEQFSTTQIQQLINVNFTAQVIVIKTLLPLLKQQQRGTIILIGSEAALSGEKQGSIYCASKFALRGFSQSLRKECANNHIAVSLINPGMVNTPFFDSLAFQPNCLQRHAIQPTEIAQLVSLILKNPSVFEEVNLQPQQKSIKRRRISGKVANKC